MNWWQAVVLGLVEGITEYLPVSSTGHLILAQQFLGLDGGGGEGHKAALDAFSIVVQGGAILAVVGLYWGWFVRMLKGLLGRDDAGLRLFVNICIAFMPAAVVGVFLDDVIEEYLFSPGPVAVALVVGGVYMMLVEQWRVGRFSMPRVTVGRGGGHGVEHGGTGGRELHELTPGRALVIGCLQILAMWPGTSRSMMTITGGVLVGLKPRAAAEFSFLLGVPTLLAATLYSLAKSFLKADENGGKNLFDVLGWGVCILGIVVAAISAALAVRWLVTFLNRHGLTPFGWYRIVLGVCLFGMIAGRVMGW